VFDTVVAYYAALGPGEQAPIPCPVLLHLAEFDEWDPPDLPASFVSALRAAGTLVLDRTWPGTRHSFANADVAAFAPEQAGQAWAETVTFLARHLRGPTR
jgi:dienelactone hydrolase